MKSIGLILLFSLFLQTAKAYPDSLIAVEYRELAIEQAKKSNIDSCDLNKSQALSIFRNNNDLVNWINTVKFIGRAYRDHGKAPQKSLSELHKATIKQLWRQPISEEEWKALGWLYVNIGYTYSWTLGQYDEATKYYEKANAILSEKLGIEDNFVGQYIFRELGNIYTRKGEYLAAEVLLTKFKDICIKNKAYSKAAEAYSDLGLMYKISENYTKAIQSFEQGLNLPKLEHRSLGLLNVNLMKVYKNLDSLELALNYAWKAKFHFEEIIKKEDLYLSKVWLGSTIIEIGDIFTDLENFKQAEVYLNQANSIFNDIYINQQRREFGHLFAYFAQLYMKWGKFELALEYHQKALQSVIADFQPDNLLENPSPSAFYAEATIMDVLSGKAEVLIQYFEHNKDVNLLETALECLVQIYEVEKQLRRSFHYESSKLFNIETSRIRSEEAIKLALQLYDLTGKKKFQQKAFEFAERSKSILLLEAFQKADATSIAGIPEHLIKDERVLQEEIAKAEKALFNAKAKEESNEVIKDLDNQLLSLRQNYTDWIQTLETQYPQYYNLKYNFNTAKIAKVQQLLQRENRALVEYFVGDSTIYTFVITPNQFEILQQDKDFPLTEWVINLRTDVEEFQFIGPDRDLLCKDYTEKAHLLYQKLIEPLKPFNLPTKLTIIPSGVLGYLPFDALLSEAPENACDFQYYPYLVKQHSISFGYSATLQYALSQNEINPSQHFVGFAPKFQEGSDFDALSFNIEGLKAVQSIINGKLFLGNNATKENFKEFISEYGIIQLATHAEANTATGDFSFVVFSDGNGGYDSLFVKDLYLLDLMAEMVVLSACETAVGTLHKGEGIISLARGFLQSGAQSVLTTLWSINDETNKLLMEEFYKQIKKGKSKDEALQLAKITQLEKADQMYAHPVYWAAFAPMGDMDAIYSGYDSVLLYIGGAILISLIILLISKYRNKQGPNSSGVVRRIMRQRPWSKVGL